MMRAYEYGPETLPVLNDRLYQLDTSAGNPRSSNHGLQLQRRRRLSRPHEAGVQASAGCIQRRDEDGRPHLQRIYIAVSNTPVT